jgi:hypothetical protein
MALSFIVNKLESKNAKLAGLVKEFTAKSKKRTNGKRCVENEKRAIKAKERERDSQRTIYNDLAKRIDYDERTQLPARFGSIPSQNSLDKEHESIRNTPIPHEPKYENVCFHQCTVEANPPPTQHQIGETPVRRKTTPNAINVQSARHPQLFSVSCPRSSAVQPLEPTRRPQPIPMETYQSSYTNEVDMFVDQTLGILSEILGST